MKRWFFRPVEGACLPDGQISFSCQAVPKKIFHLCRWANQWRLSARLTRQEGRLAIVTKRAVGCGGRGSCD
jgi:hypothetical protein